MMLIADTSVTIGSGSACTICFTISCCGIDIIAIAGNDWLIYLVILRIRTL